MSIELDNRIARIEATLAAMAREIAELRGKMKENEPFVAPTPEELDAMIRATPPVKRGPGRPRKVVEGQDVA